MFTGIVTAVGEVIEWQGAGASKLERSGPVDRNNSEGRLVLFTPFTDVALGESIAINGVCLTVTEIQKQQLCFFVSCETIEKTNLSTLACGTKVNLERALRLSDRLSGHLVQGHVDGFGVLKKITASGESFELEVDIPNEFLSFVSPKGSIALDGISLTINKIKNNTLSFMIIPHTWEHTTLSTKTIESKLNLEFDLISKHIARLYAQNFRSH